MDHALSRFVREGVLVRVTRGVYMRPKVNAYVGQVAPSAEAVAEAAARACGARIQASGATAAAAFGLSTQQPLLPAFSTTGPTRRFRVGNLVVEMKHAPARRMMLAGRPAGAALAALWHLGKFEVNGKVVARLRAALPPAEFRALVAAMPSQPAWMARAFLAEPREG